MANCLFPYIEWPDQKKQPLEDAVEFLFPFEKKEALLCKLKYSRPLQIATVLFLFKNRCPVCGEFLHRDESRLRVYWYCHHCSMFGDVQKYTIYAYRHRNQDINHKTLLDVFVAAAVGDIAIGPHGQTYLSQLDDYAEPELYKEWEDLNKDRIGPYNHGYMKSSLDAYIKEKIAMRKTLNKAYCEFYPEILMKEFYEKMIANGDCDNGSNK